MISEPTSTQMDLFTIIDHEKKEFLATQRFLEHKELYEKWLTLPDNTFVQEGSQERANISSVLRNSSQTLYGSAHHVCHGIPEGHYIWLNSCTDNYWVLRDPDKFIGTHVPICPFCGANLEQGKGDAVLIKAEQKHWLFFLHYETPMHVHGFQPAEDRAAIREVRG